MVGYIFLILDFLKAKPEMFHLKSDPKEEEWGTRGVRQQRGEAQTRMASWFGYGCRQLMFFLTNPPEGICELYHNAAHLEDSRRTRYPVAFIIPWSKRPQY